MRIVLNAENNALVAEDLVSRVYCVLYSCLCVHACVRERDKLPGQLNFPLGIIV